MAFLCGKTMSQFWTHLVCPKAEKMEPRRCKRYLFIYFIGVRTQQYFTHTMVAVLIVGGGRLLQVSPLTIGEEASMILTWTHSYPMTNVVWSHPPPGE